MWHGEVTKKLSYRVEVDEDMGYQIEVMICDIGENYFMRAYVYDTYKRIHVNCLNC